MVEEVVVNKGAVDLSSVDEKVRQIEADIIRRNSPEKLKRLAPYFKQIIDGEREFLNRLEYCKKLFTKQQARK